MAQSVATVSPDITIDNTLGALFVGFAVACCVYGILLSQIYTYLAHYPMDRPIYKFIVLLILTLETVDQVLIGQIYYHYGISNFSNPLALIEGAQKWSFILQQTLGSVVGTMVKIAFALRVPSVSQQNFWITGLIMVLTLGGMSLSIVFTVKSQSVHHRFMLPDVFAVVQLRVYGTISLGVGVLTDIVTALSLCYFLNKLRTGYRQSDSLVSTLIKYAINTGALTSVVSVTTVILYNIMPNNLIFIAVFFILSKLYAISFMATLNTRRVVRGRGTDKQNTTTNHTNMFHLGTRVPSMPPADMDGWETAYTTTSATKPEFDPHRPIPLNTIASASQNPTLGKYYPDEV
ncbi:hypothetical protein J3R30DRAFT_3849561 [Lentinula aciculospora]|uniref:DUF6534 domain-containing protein n=1 Tax=Lentinula aciculospora TaxID=153920 RepID=A0A9W9DF16_9AGAR|nr:hypothetical protein J3R30DRAFT_3849561 [Lentinula aciculospora]